MKISISLCRIDPRTSHNFTYWAIPITRSSYNRNLRW